MSCLRAAAADLKDTAVAEIKKAPRIEATTRNKSCPFQTTCVAFEYEPLATGPSALS
jgi:hypothetical protein